MPGFWRRLLRALAGPPDGLSAVIIPPTDADRLLAAFGVGTDSPDYTRWRRESGFRLSDLETLLSDSRDVLAVDWRDALSDAIDVMVAQLEAVGFKASADLDDEGRAGELRVDGEAVPVKYVPADHDDFDEIIAAVNPLIGGAAQYRKFRSSEGSDGWWYAILPLQTWERLQVEAARSMDLLFTDVGAR